MSHAITLLNDSMFDPAAMPEYQTLPDAAPKLVSTPPWLAYLAVASAAVSGFHGYRRNKSVGWGIAWFFLGGLFPVIVPTIAVAEGFGKPKRS